MPSSNGSVAGRSRAILYARVSTEEQARKGYSLAQQLEALNEYAAREGYDLLEEVVDPGQSGASLERPGMDRVRDLVAAGGVSVVLAQDRDRFAREPAYHYLLRREFEEHSTKLRALNDRGDDTPEGELTDGILDQLAKFERAKTAERSRRGKLRKAREGKIVATKKINYGFKYNAERDGYEVREEHMAVVRRIFRMIGTERLSMNLVKRTFDREGIPTPDGGSYWAKKTIREAILDDVYRPHIYEEIAALVSPEVAARLNPDECYGIWWFNRRRFTRTRAKRSDGNGGSEYYWRQHYELRPREEWIAVPVPDSSIPRKVVEAARDAIKENRRTSAAGYRFWELSGGVLYCGGCGCRMTTTRQRKTSESGYYHYYRCPKKLIHGSEACPMPRMVRAEKIEALVWSFVLDYLKDPERLRAGLEAYIAEEHAAIHGDPEREAKAWLDRIAEADRQRKRAQDLAVEGLLSPEVLREKLTYLADQRQTAERELEALRGRTERIANLELEAEALLEHYTGMTREGLEAYTPEDKHDAYKALRLRVILHPDGRMEADGVFILEPPELCNSEPARGLCRSAGNPLPAPPV
jgi:site-specific DNA recombinase